MCVCKVKSAIFHEMILYIKQTQNKYVLSDFFSCFYGTTATSFSSFDKDRSKVFLLTDTPQNQSSLICLCYACFLVKFRSQYAYKRYAYKKNM